MPRTIGTLFTEALVILQDVAATRFPRTELMEAFNSAMSEARGKRPDVFLGMGLRTPLPYYNAADDLNVAFPIDEIYYSSVLYYIVGRMDLRESVNGDEGRSVALMNKFVAQLLGVAA